MPTYRIIADEAWTHNNDFRRYWCIFGALMASEDDHKKITNTLNEVKKRAPREIKWSNINGENLALYEEYIDTFFDVLLQCPSAIYRQLNNSRNFIHKPTFDTQNPFYPVYPRINEVFGVDAQFLIYQQFLKHSFGFDELPAGTDILFELDEHSSQPHKRKLDEYVNREVSLLGNINMVKTHFIKSARNPVIPGVDLITGSFGFIHNKLDAARVPGKRGMSDKQKIKLAFAKRIRKLLADISNAERKALAFTWPETTGSIDHPQARSRQKVRVWKFKPRFHYHDAGWLNDRSDDGLGYKGAELNSYTYDAGSHYTALVPCIRFQWR